MTSASRRSMEKSAHCARGGAAVNLANEVLISLRAALVTQQIVINLHCSMGIIAILLSCPSCLPSIIMLVFLPRWPFYAARVCVRPSVAGARSFHHRRGGVRPRPRSSSLTLSNCCLHIVASLHAQGRSYNNLDWTEYGTSSVLYSTKA